jgi:hypothetical protein
MRAGPARRPFNGFQKERRNGRVHYLEIVLKEGR